MGFRRCTLHITAPYVKTKLIQTQRIRQVTFNDQTIYLDWSWHRIEPTNEHIGLFLHIAYVTNDQQLAFAILRKFSPSFYIFRTGAYRLSVKHYIRGFIWPVTGNKLDALKVSDILQNVSYDTESTTCFAATRTSVQPNGSTSVYTHPPHVVNIAKNSTHVPETL